MGAYSSCPHSHFTIPSAFCTWRNGNGDFSEPLLRARDADCHQWPAPPQCLGLSEQWGLRSPQPPPASGTLSCLLFLSHSSASLFNKYVFSKCTRPAPVLKKAYYWVDVPCSDPPGVLHMAVDVQSGWFWAPHIKLHFMGLISTSWIAPL